MRFSNPLHVPSIRLPEGFWSLGGGFEAWIGDFGARRARPLSYSSPLWVFAPFYLPSAEISKKSHFPTLPAGPLQTPSVWSPSSRSCSAGWLLPLPLAVKWRNRLEILPYCHLAATWQHLLGPPPYCHLLVLLPLPLAAANSQPPLETLLYCHLAQWHICATYARNQNVQVGWTEAAVGSIPVSLTNRPVSLYVFK